mmetsp:Transcript_84765/g.169661  ORF Transcript_84765/g.169661 Transcript_84765/m.169661 type:complete len:90 (+) Transcript_84765:224-493(+)
MSFLVSISLISWHGAFNRLMVQQQRWRPWQQQVRRDTKRPPPPPTPATSNPSSPPPVVRAPSSSPTLPFSSDGAAAEAANPHLKVNYIN